MILWQLFVAFLYIGTFAFGGGYAILPLIEEVMVTNLGWLTFQEMTDITSISQVDVYKRQPLWKTMNNASAQSYRSGNSDKNLD